MSVVDNFFKKKIASKVKMENSHSETKSISESNIIHIPECFISVYFIGIYNKKKERISKLYFIEKCRSITSMYPDISFEHLNVLVAYELKKESCKHKIWFGSDNLLNDVGICMAQHLSGTGLKKENY